MSKIQKWDSVILDSGVLHSLIQIILYDMIVQEVIIIPLCSKCSLKVAKKLNYESLIILTVPI